MKRGIGFGGLKRTAAAAAALLAALACREGDVRTRTNVPASGPRAESIERLAGQRVWFGHQSVGFDIMGGVRAIARERPELELNVVEGRTAEALAAPAFAHAPNGKNRDPVGKIRDFAATIEGGLGERTDLALFKFCYVDFDEKTDVEQVFEEYRTTMARLEARFPEVTFVHVTVPLTVVQTGPRAWVKRLLGRMPWGAEQNIARERFNALLREEYAARAPLFDLAVVESTRADGREVIEEDGGTRYRALAAEHASDGEHLNELGARRAAAGLIETLAAAAAR